MKALIALLVAAILNGMVVGMVQVEALGPLAKAIQTYGIAAWAALATIAMGVQYIRHEKYRDAREAGDRGERDDLKTIITDLTKQNERMADQLEAFNNNHRT